jgi:hypothetical protein
MEAIFKRSPGKHPAEIESRFKKVKIDFIHYSRLWKSRKLPKKREGQNIKN